MRRSNGVGHWFLGRSQFLREQLHQARRTFARLAGEDALRSGAGRGATSVRPQSLPLRLRTRWACDVGLRGRADVELQTPAAVAVDGTCTTDRSCRFRSGGRAGAPATCPSRADCVRVSTVRIGGRGVICSRSIGTSSPGRSVKPRAGDEQRKLDRFGDQQLKGAVGQLDILPGSALPGTRQTAAGASLSTPM